MIRTRNKQPRLPGFCKQTEHYKGLYYQKKKKKFLIETLSFMKEGMQLIIDNRHRMSTSSSRLLTKGTNKLYKVGGCFQFCTWVEQRNQISHIGVLF